MSRDPYLDVKRDVEHTLANTHTLLSSFQRIAATVSQSSPQLTEARNELTNNLGLLEGDLEDLEESVRVVEEMGGRWGIDDKEVRARRAFVQSVRRELQSIRSTVTGEAPVRDKGKGVDRSFRDASDMENGQFDGRRSEDDDEVERWEREEQQTMMRRQDDTLGVISGALINLASQAGLIGQEVGEQGEMLDDLSTRVDVTESKLKKASKRMQEFIRKNEETKSGWCIVILIVILIILLLMVILI